MVNFALQVNGEFEKIEKLTAKTNDSSQLTFELVF